MKTTASPASLPRFLKPAAIFCLMTTLVSVIGLGFDPRWVTGAPVWLKPLKFSVSILILLWTYAQYWPWVQKQARMRFWFDLSSALLTLEMLLVVIQAARGVPSHFNLTTYFDMTVFSIMGVSIGVFWVGSMFLLHAFVKIPSDRNGMVWAARLGLILGILGMGMAWKMTGPTPSQLQEMTARGVPVGGMWGGAHSVGVAEDAPGLALMGWKSGGGDLRVAHFLGLHAMQLLWVLALVLAYVAPRLRISPRLWILGGVFGVLFVATVYEYVRALRGLPFF